MKIGYARVSTDKQNLRSQIQQLEAAGAERIFSDHGISGNAVIKPGLNEALEFARAGDTILIARLDRLCRSLSALIETARDFDQRGLHFQSLREQIETDSPSGRLYFHLIGALAQFERDIISQRTKDGLAAARRAGKRLGRPPKVSDQQWQQAMALREGDSETWNASKLAKLLGVSRQAVHKRLEKVQDSPDK